MESLSGVSLSDWNSNKRALENGYCSTTCGGELKYKRRKVSAIRDFPPGCGRNAPRINLSPPETGVALVVTDKTPDVVVADGLKISEIGVESVSHEAVKSPIQMEMMESLDNLVRKVVGTAGTVNGVEKLSIDVEPLGLEVELPKHLANNAVEFSEELYEVEVEVKALVEEYSNEGEVQDLVKESSNEVKVHTVVKNPGALENKTVLEIGASLYGAVPVGSAKLWSPPKWPISDVNVPDGTAPKNKYCRRRIAATRSFPPFCGRNAPRPTEEDRLRITSGRNSKDMEGGGGVVESGTMGGTVRVVSEESERSVRDGNVRKGESKNIVLERRNKFFAIFQRSNKHVNGAVGRMGKEIVVSSHEKSPKTRLLGDAVDLRREPDRANVQALMAAPNYQWRQGEVDLTVPDDVLVRNKVKKHGFNMQEKSKFGIRMNTYGTNHLSGKFMKRKSISICKSAYRGLDNVGFKYRESYDAYNEEKNEYSSAGRGPSDFNVRLPPFGPNSSTNGDARNRVRETRQLFQTIFRKILQGEESKSRPGEEGRSQQHGKDVRRIDLRAAKIMKEKGKEVNTGKQIVGAVPGVEVGDEFQYRVELAVVGIHRLYQSGIDYVKLGKQIVATSIVASGGYDDELDNADVLIYSGQGGNLIGKDKQPEDQKLQRGNLALKNSISAKNPVRVIKGFRETKAADSLDARAKIALTYVYDGLYMVEKYWQEVGPHGKLVFKFELSRISGQPELAWKEVKKSKKFKMREGLCDDDISRGKELFPIFALNRIDDQKPTPFNYITRMIYPDQYLPIPPKGCDCIGGCVNSQRCSCAFKNGGEFPYNYNGAIVESKPLVYECGPSCKCPPSCYNRVSQHGIKIQLEIFKTESRGWGVRSLSSISSGSFICEYIGELLEDKEAEQRTSNDEYLFDIGQNYNDCSFNPNEKSSASEVVEDGGFTIDGAQYGNVGRFINHSCSPNLYAQNVLYDHANKRMPHIMLFAAEHIPSMKELTYHYNYSVDQVHDSNGNIKMKGCYCGSMACTGRMY